MANVRSGTQEAGSAAPGWYERLSDEDRVFIKQFVLASGSLKQLAAIYDISYPTVRLRLDRLIERIKILEAPEIGSDFERTLRLMYAERRIDLPTLKELLAAHRREMKETSE